MPLAVPGLSPQLRKDLRVRHTYSLAARRGRRPIIGAIPKWRQLGKRSLGQGAQLKRMLAGESLRTVGLHYPLLLRR